MSLWAALLPALLLAARGAAGAAAEDAGDAVGEADLDSAPFMVVVQHLGGRRCAGSLVSRSTALTAAACARGASSLWAQSAGGGPGGRRRVLRVAEGADLALLELERPFAESARARTILMAMEAGECDARGAGGKVRICHAVRLFRGRLRIVDATLAPPGECTAAAPADIERDRAFCLTGPEMCDSDIGTGVVCGGKLCGVLAHSARAGGGGGDGGGGARGQRACGNVHWAARVSRWRHFVHCAHALRACGRGDCAKVCTERRLKVEDDGADAEPPPTPSMPPPAPTRSKTAPPVDVDTGELGYMPPIARASDTTPDTTPDTEADTTPVSRETKSIGTRHRTSPARSPPAPLASPVPTEPPHAPTLHTQPRPVFDWEPGRADFRAGDYGDNAAQYAVGEDPAPPPRPARPRARAMGRRRGGALANVTLTPAPNSTAVPARAAGAAGNHTARMRVPTGSSSCSLTSASVMLFTLLCVIVK